MTTTDTNLNNLIINTMTKATYDTITPSPTELYMVTDDPLSSNDVINALGYTPANNTDIDGFWTIPSSPINICSSVSLNGSGTADFALSSVLPNDGNLYEMQLSCTGETGTASGNRIQLIISNSGSQYTGYFHVFDVIARSAARVFASNTILFLAKNTDTIKLTKNSTYTGTVTINLLAYRKVR